MKFEEMVQTVTWFMDKLFALLRLKEQDMGQLQSMICMVNLVFSIYPLICYFVYSSNIHVIFWMGPIVQYCNLTVPISLCLLNGGVMMISNMRMATKNSQKICFALFLLLGAANMGMGLWVMIEAERVAEELIVQCGTTTLTARIEAEWQKLNQFYKSCTEPGSMLIQECPGYNEAFPNKVYVNYIEDVEMDYNCVGFCQFWAAPIFNQDADRGLRCATALGDEMLNVKKMVGVVSMITGTIIASFGLCLFLYDHL